MFLSSGLQLNRGLYNSQQQAGNLTSCVHTYKSTTDMVAAIMAPGYFPDNFNSDINDVEIGDLLWIVGSDSFSVTEITALSPVTVIINPTSNVFPGGLTTSSINFTVASGGGFIDYFAVAGLGATWTGPWASPISLSDAIRTYLINDLCTLEFVQIPFISGVTPSIITLQDPLPEDFNPDSDKTFGPYLMVNNDIRVLGTVHITSSGVVTISSDLSDSGTFNGPGSCGFYTISVTFNVND